MVCLRWGFVYVIIFRPTINVHVISYQHPEIYLFIYYTHPVTDKSTDPDPDTQLVTDGNLIL